MKAPHPLLLLGLPALLVAVLASLASVEAQQLPILDGLVNTLSQHFRGDQSKKEFVPHSYIVTFDKDQVHPDNYDGTLKDFYAHLQKDNDFEIKHKYSYNAPGFLMGAAFEARSTKTGDKKRSAGTSRLTRAQHLISSLHVFSKAKAVPTVKTIHRDRIIHRLDQPASLSGKRPIRKRQDGQQKDGFTMYKQRFDGADGEMTARDDPVVIPTDFSPHVLTGVNIQHAQGNYGNGVTLCIIDSPVDYSNDALNGELPDQVPCFGGDCPIAGGYDEFGKGFDGEFVHPGKPYYQGLNETEDCYHGTHTIGTVIANSTLFAGAAPQARAFIHSGFACGKVPPGTGPPGGIPLIERESGLINSFQRAAVERCEVISGSFGADGAWCDETDTLAAAANYVAEETALVVISQGNARGGGAFFAGSPACGPKILSVGSTEVGKLPVQAIVPDQPVPGLDFAALYGQISWTYQEDIKNVGIYFTQAFIADQTVADDACNPLPKDTPDLKGKIVFVLRGACRFRVKIANLKEYGAERVVIIFRNNEDHEWLIANELDPDLKSAALTNLDSGTALLKAYLQNPDLTVTVNPEGPHVWKFLDNPAVDRMSDFSSQGPGNDMRMKPTLSAPGTGILSTYPGSWSNGVLSGTSMATPLVAGLGLLMKSVKGGEGVTFDEIRRRLTQTTRNAAPDKGDTSPVPLILQGSGIANVTAAIELTTHVDPPTLDEIGDTPHSQGKLNPTITITNEGDAPQEYTLKHTPAQSVLALQDGGPTTRKDSSQMIWLSTPEKIDEVATLEFDPPTFKLESFAEQKVQVTIKPPADNPRMLIYSGWIEVQSSDPVGSARLPYGGIAGDLSLIPALQTGLSPYNTNLPGLYDANLTEQIQDDKSAWALNDDDPDSLPNIVFAQQTASHQIYIDIVAADIDYTPTVPIVDDNDPFQGNLSLYTKKERDAPSSKYVKVSEVPIVGRIEDDTGVTRDNVDASFLDNGGFRAYALSSSLSDPADPEVYIDLDPGQYRVLIRSAKWFTKKEDLYLEASYDSYLSHIFTFDPKAAPRPPPPANGNGGGGKPNSAEKPGNNGAHAQTQTPPGKEKTPSRRAGRAGSGLEE